MSSFGVFMSYCRQENTYKAICEAIDQIEEYQNDPEMDMSDSEIRYFRKSVKKVVYWLYDMSILGNEDEFDESNEEMLENILNDICKELKKC